MGAEALALADRLHSLAADLYRMVVERRGHEKLLLAALTDAMEQADKISDQAQRAPEPADLETLRPTLLYLAEAQPGETPEAQKARVEAHARLARSMERWQRP